MPLPVQHASLPSMAGILSRIPSPLGPQCGHGNMQPCAQREAAFLLLPILCPRSFWRLLYYVDKMIT